MKKLTGFFLLTALTSATSFAQFKLPEGYAISNDVNDSLLSLKVDFNKDGMKDQFAVIEKDGNKKLIAFISKGKGTKQFRMISHPESAYFDCCSTMSFEKNVITIATTGMRYFQYYKFRYNNKLSNFELIGYDTESFGNAIHDGAGTQSLNMLTGSYESSVYTAIDENDGTNKTDKKKINIPKKFTLSNFNEAVTFLRDLE